MHSHLCWRQTKDQPIVAKVHRGPFQNVAEESAISVRVFAVEKEMRSVDHDRSLEDQQHRGNKSGAKRRYVKAYTFTSAASVLLVKRSTSLNSKPYWRSLAAHTVAFSVMAAVERSEE